MQFKKETREAIKFLRNMQGTAKYKRNVWKVNEQKNKVDNRQVFAIDNIL